MSGTDNFFVFNELSDNNPDMHTINPNLNSKSGGFVYSAAAILQIAVSVVIIVAISFIGGFMVGTGKCESVEAALSLIQNSKSYLYLSFLMSPVVFAVCALVTLKMRKIKFKEIFPVKCHPKYYLIGLLVISGLFLCLNQINDWFMQLIGKEEGDTYILLNQYLATLSGWDIPLAFLTFAILPAFFEELIFRGIMMNATEQSMGTVRTIFVVGFCFALFHGAVEQSIYQFLAGCLFTFVAIRSGSILPGMMMHFLNNGIVVLLAACGLYAEDTAEAGAGSPVATIVMTILGACCLIGGLIWLILDKKPIKKCQQGGVKNFFIFASVGLAIMLIMLIVSLF